MFNSNDFYIISYHWISLSLLLLIGCSSSSSQDGEFEVITVEGVQEIITPETAPGLAFPAFVRTAPDYFFIYDAQLQKLVKFNYDGEELLSFGREGRGPGELQSLTNYWIMEDHYLLYDYNGAKMVRYNLDGSFRDEDPVNIGELTAGVESLSAQKFIHPANGENGALLKTFTLNDEKVVYIGKTISEGPGRDLSPDETRNLISRGEIPDEMKDNLCLGANSTGIFSFQSAYAVLQKFTETGDLLWEKDVKNSSLDGVYEEFVREAKDPDRMIPLLTYCRDIHALQDGAAVFLNTAEEKPVTILWVSNVGDDIRVIEYPEVEKTRLLRFRVAGEQQAVLFVDSMAGKVFKVDWPVGRR